MARSRNLGGKPTHYEILAITPKHLEGQSAPAQAKVVKKAYHRALLLHHPDKANTSKGDPQDSRPSPSPSSSSSKPHSSSSAAYTVDQIQEAYAVLSDSKQRTEYNRALFQHSHSHPTPSSSSHNGTATATAAMQASFRAGVETADLDDLGFDERAGGVYYRACRCGNARGYRFGDADLEASEDDGVLLVGCLDCSLWLRVLFASGPPAGEEDEEDEEGGAVNLNLNLNINHQQQQQRQSKDREVVTGGGGGGGGVGGGGERSGSGEGRGAGFKVNWSFSWGVSAGASASVSASASASSSSAAAVAAATRTGSGS